MINYEPPPWLVDFADPNALQDFKDMMKVIEKLNNDEVEKMTQGEFEQHQKEIFYSIKMMIHQMDYQGKLIKQHGSPKEIKEWEKAWADLTKDVTESTNRTNIN